MLVLDSGGVTFLARRKPAALAAIDALRTAGLWPPLVPTIVLVESLRGSPGLDANTNRFLKACILDEIVPSRLARRAADLRRRARRGSAVDAIVVARAEPGGTILTGDVGDLGALAAAAEDVVIEPLRAPR